MSGNDCWLLWLSVCGLIALTEGCGIRGHCWLMGVYSLGSNVSLLLPTCNIYVNSLYNYLLTAIMMMLLWLPLLYWQVLPNRPTVYISYSKSNRATTLCLATRPTYCLSCSFFTDVLHFLLLLLLSLVLLLNLLLLLFNYQKILNCLTHWTVFFFVIFTFRVDGQSHPLMSLRPSMFGQTRNPNTTKGQENLLVALANWRRVVGLTLPNSSGSMVCAPIMEYLDTI